MANPNPYIGYPVGTCFKEIYNGEPCFYLLGEYYVYQNFYEGAEIRPWKIDVSQFTIASEDEKKQFIEDLKKNNLIWDEKTGKLEREFEEITLNVKVKVKPGTDINKILEKLNDKHYESPYGIYEMEFEKI